MKATQILYQIQSGKLDQKFIGLYGENKLSTEKARYAKAITEYINLYTDDSDDVAIFSVPGRSEIAGNHTDHNHGCVLAAALDLDIIAVASKIDKMQIRVKSEGFSEDIVDISALDPDRFKKFTSLALIAGVCDGFSKRNYKYGGFVAYTTSNVLKGSGISSSAAFEVQICNIINHLYNNGAIPNTELAKISQYSENVFFGKPCGLMDQMACAVGGFVAIDFNDPTNPIIEKLDFNLFAYGYSLCIVNTGGNHANLNDDYASISSEMKSVASFFGKSVLRGLTYNDIFAAIPNLRDLYGDRAVLRAIHFIEENDRVLAQKAALKAENVSEFLNGVLASGDSSFKQLQNIFTVKNVSSQGISLALALCKNFLADKKGAWRVHGGGFAGTILAFVPTDNVCEFKQYTEAVFGENACQILRVRPEGAIKFYE